MKLPYYWKKFSSPDCTAVYDAKNVSVANFYNDDAEQDAKDFCDKYNLKMPVIPSEACVLAKDGVLASYFDRPFFFNTRKEAESYIVNNKDWQIFSLRDILLLQEKA
jgi:hypothetical protein